MQLVEYDRKELYFIIIITTTIVERVCQPKAIVCKYAQENIIIFIIALKEVCKYYHLVVVMVIEILVNSPYNAVMSGRLLEAGHSLLCLYYELLLQPIIKLIYYLKVT